MGKRTKKEQDQAYEKFLERCYQRQQQRRIAAGAGRQKLEELQARYDEAAQRVRRKEEEIYGHPQNVLPLDHPDVKPWIQELDKYNIQGEDRDQLMREARRRQIPRDDPVWGAKVKELGRLQAARNTTWDNLLVAKEAYRRRWRLFDLLPPNESTTEKLQAWNFARLLSHPGILEGTDPVEPIFPWSAKSEGNFVSTTLFNGKILLLAVNFDCPDSVLRPAFDGALQFVRGNLPDRRRERTRLRTEARRTRVLALKAIGKTREQIADELFPQMMKSKKPEVRKRALQRVTDATKTHKK